MVSYTRDDVDALQLLAAHVESLIDPDDDRCSIDPDVKRAVSPYVGAWIAPLVAALLDRAQYGAQTTSRSRLAIRDAAHNRRRQRVAGHGGDVAAAAVARSRARVGR